MQFIHKSVKAVHLDINLRNIYITPSGSWKLAGFGFAQPCNNQDESCAIFVGGMRVNLAYRLDV